MNWFYLVTGIAVLSVVTIDFMLTTIGSNRTGGLTQFIADKVWRGLQFINATFSVRVLAVAKRRRIDRSKSRGQSEVVHHSLLLGRYEPSRHVGSEAKRAG